MGELDVEHAAVSLDQRESVELSLVALIIERAEVSPVDFEALAGCWFHAHEGARGGTGHPHPPEVLAQESRGTFSRCGRPDGDGGRCDASTNARHRRADGFH